MAVVVTTPARALPAPRALKQATVRVERLAALGVAALGLELVVAGLGRVLPGVVWLEWGERALLSLTWLLVLATAAAVWNRWREEPGLLLAASRAPVGLLAQATLEALVDSAV